MRTACHHLLVIVCSLLLAAPFGWCCFVPAFAQAEETAPVRCPHCPQHDEPRPAAPDESPSPAEPMNCPCLEKQATARDGSEKFQPNLVTLAVPVALDVPAVAREVPTSSAFSSSQSLHLLHCVWLC